MIDTQKRLSAVLVADIAGFTKAMEQDSDGTVVAWREAREDIISPLLDHYRGNLIKYTGDGFLAEFQSIQNAVDCAVKMRTELQSSPLKFRMGINLGDVIEDGKDIYGEGVNIAARIEALGQPGDICVTTIVRDAVKNRMPFEFEDMGPQELKNVSSPINVFIVPRDVFNEEGLLVGRNGDVAQTADIDVEAKAVDKPKKASILDRPAVAILPFKNMSNDEEQEYFADGITEDIITELARANLFPVIARNSTFTYKDTASDVREIASALGASYVVEGSVRKGGNKIRISAQLVDARSGQNIWAERYDRELTDIFDVQDEITMSLAGAIMPELYVEQQKIVLRKQPGTLEAWDLMLKAQWNHAKFTKNNFEDARVFLFEALELDPSIPMVHALVSDIALWSLSVGWRSDHQQALAEAAKHASAALSLDANNAHARACLSWVELFSGNPEKAKIEADQAIQSNPSYAVIRVYCGNMYVTLGEFELAFEQFRVMKKLSPRDPLLFIADAYSAIGYYLTGEYEQAIQSAQQSLRHNENFFYTLITLAAAFGQVGQLEEASKTVATLEAHAPPLSNEFVKSSFAFPDTNHIEHFITGLKKAGVSLE